MNHLSAIPLNKNDNNMITYYVNIYYCQFRLLKHTYETEYIFINRYYKFFTKMRSAPRYCR